MYQFKWLRVATVTLFGAIKGDLTYFKSVLIIFYVNRFSSLPLKLHCACFTIELV